MKSKSAFQLVRIGSRAACVLAAATAALLTAHSVRAATFVWANSNVTGATPASSLNWFNATQGAWSGGTPVSGNTNTIQFFQDITTALGNTGGSGNSQTSVIDNSGSPFQLGTLTLSGLASATTGANLAMTISGDALNFSGATGRINLDALNNTRTLTYNLNSNIQLGTAGSGSALTLAGNGTGTFIIGGIISELQSGGGSLTKSGTSTVNLTSANTYTGTTTLNAGILNLSGNGSIATSTGLTLNGGGITLTNINDTEGAIDRVAAVTITSNGGTITYNNTNTGTAYAEVLGALVLTKGQLNIVSTNAVTSGTETLTLGAGSLTHAAANTSAITFSGGSLGASSKNSIIVTSQATTGTDTIIGPWATFGTTAALQSDYATYNITGGAANAFGIQNANIAATTDGNWTDSTKAYTSNVGGALALGPSTHNMLGLRNTGATTVMTIPTGGNLNTYGLLNGVSTLLTVAATGTGALSTPTGGGNLFVTTGSGAITLSAPINDNAGAVTLVAGGGGTLILTGTNSYTGGTVINAGILQVGPSGSTSDNMLGATSGTITLNGGQLKVLSTNLSTARDVVVGAAGGSIAVNGNNNFTTTGKLTGSGTLTFTDAGGAGGRQLNFYSPSNDFTGTISMPNSGSSDMTIRFNSLKDAPGAGNIRFTSNGGKFEWASGAGAQLVLNNRQIELAGTAGPTIYSNSTNAASIITINTDLLVTNAGAKTLTLAGTNTGNNTFAGKIGDGTGAVISLTKPNDASNWILSGSSTYTGVTTISGGTLSITGVADAGLSSPLGAYASTGAAGISLGAGTLKYIGASSASTNRGFSTAGNGTVDVARVVTLSLGACSISGGNLTVASSGGGGIGTLSLGATTMTAAKAINTTTGKLTIASLALGANNTIFDTSSGTAANGITITGAVTGSGTVTKTGATAGYLTLSGPSTYTGQTILQRGFLNVTSLNNLGSGGLTPLASSSLGAPTTIANGTIKIGTAASTTPAATLVYTGTGETTDRVIDLAGTTAGAVLDQSGTNLLKFTSYTGTTNAFTATGAGIKTLTLQGSTAGTGEIAAIIPDNGGATSLTKTGTGTWTLSGTNTYTGATTLSAGTLNVTGSLASGSAVTVNSTAILGISGTINGTVTVNAGGALGGTGTMTGLVTAATGGAVNLVNGSIGQINFTNAGSGLTLSGTAAAPNNLYFDIAAGGTSDKIAATGTIVVSNAGGAVINLKPTTNWADIADGTSYTLVTAGTAITNPGNIAMATKAFGKVFTLTSGAASTQVTVNSATAGPAAAFWNGGTAAWNAAGNWNTTASDNVGTGAIPGVGTDVTFVTTTPAAGNLSNTLSADFEINSLTLNAAGGGVTIGGTNANTLVLDAASGSGITSSNTSGTNTISANVGLGGNQTWTVASGGALTISGNVTDFGTGKSLTKSGTGTLTLSGTNTFSGGFTLNAGKVTLTTNNAIGTGTLTINGGTYSATNVTIANNPIVINNSCTLDCASANNFNFGTGQITLGNSAVVTMNLGQSPNLSNNWTDSGAGYNLTLINTQDGGTTISGNINTAGSLSLQNYVNVIGKTLTVSGTGSTFTGPTTLLYGGANCAIVTPNLSNAGIAGSLGAPIGANSVIQINNDVIWQPGGTTDRGVNLATNGAGTVQIIVNSSSGTATFNGPITATGTGAKTLYVNLPFNNPVTLTINGAISDGSDGSPLSLRFNPGYNGSGDGNYASFYLNGLNTFSGPINFEGTGSKFQSSTTGCSLNISGTGCLGYNAGTGTGNYANTINLSNTIWALLNYSSSANQTLAGVISGAGNLTMNGTGNLTLSAANTYSGTTTLSAGTLTLGNNLALQNSALTISAAGLMTLSSGVTTPTIGGLSGSRNLASVITSGYGNTTALTINPRFGISNTFSGVIAEGAAGMTLTKTGMGTQILSGANLYTGATTISAGVLQLGTGTSGQNGSVASTSMVDNAVLAFNNADAQTYAGNISGTGSLTKSGAGTLILSGTNNYAGPTIINAGVLQYNALSAIAATSRNIAVAAGATVALNFVPAVSIQSDLLSKIVAGSAGAVALGTAASPVSENLDFSSAGNDFTALSLGAVGAASYSGTLTPNGTTYRLGGGGGTLTFAPATYTSTNDLVLFSNGLTGVVDFTGSSATTFGAITISGGTLQNGSLTGTSYAANNPGAATVSANLLVNGTAGLTKSGAGTLTLTGANTYTGATTVNFGTLVADTATNATVLSSSSVLAFTGTGTFQLKGLSGQARAQIFNGLTLTAGAATVDANNVAGGTSTTIDLRGVGAPGTLGITRSTGATVDFKASTGTFGTTAIVNTAQTNDTTNILGAWATVNGGADWAINNAGVVAAYTGYNTLSATTLASSGTTNYRIATNPTTPTGNITMAATGTIDVNTLRITDTAARTIDVRNGTTAGILRFGAVGGILTSGGNHIIGVGSTGGTITAGGAPNTVGELIVNTGTGTLQINSVIADNGSGKVSLTKTGAGTLYLLPGGNALGANPNTFTGGATIDQGTIQTGSVGSNALGTGPLTIQGGITLNIGGNNVQTFNNSSYSLNGDFTTSGNVLNFSTGNVTLGTSVTLTDNNAFNINTVVSDGGNAYGITKAGTGTLKLAASNSYTGKTVVLAGTLQVDKGISNAGVNGNLGAPTLASGNSTIDLYPGATLYFSGTQGTYSTDRALNLAGNGGTTTISASNNDSYFTFSGITATGTGSKTLALSLSGDRPGMTFSGAIPDVSDGSPLGLTATWSGNDQTVGAGRGFNLNGVNTFTGPITLNAVTARLTIGGAGQLGSGTYANTITLNGGGFYYNSSAAQTLSGVISGTGTVTEAGSGTLTLSGANTYTGVTSVSGGTLSLTSIDVVANANPLGKSSNAAANLLLGNATTLQYTGGAASTDRLFTINGTAAGNDATLQASGTGALNFTNTGALAYGTTAQTRTLYLSGTNTDSNTLAPLIGNNGSGAVSLTKLGVGKWALSNTNTYTGATSVSAGTLTINPTGTINSTSGVSIDAGNFNYNSSTAMSQPVSFASTGGTLSGTGTITPAVTVTSGNNLSPGASAGTLNFVGGLTLADGSIFNWENNTVNTPGTAGSHWDVVNVTGGTTTISSTATTGAQLKLMFTNALTNFADTFWNSNQSWKFITGGVSATNLFDTTNIAVFINSVQQGLTNIITGEGAFSTAVNGSDLELLWTPDISGAPEIAFSEGGDIASGGSKGFGSIVVGANTSLTFTISNIGTADLNLTGSPKVALSGDADFTVTAQPSTPVSSPTGTTTFTVQFAPTTTGARNAVLTILNNDSDEGTFTINLSGTGTTLYAVWALANGLDGTAGKENGVSANPDGDASINSVEFAFDTDPLNSTSAPITYVSGGTVTTHGTPVILKQSGLYYAVFGRRTNHVAAGLTYKVQFSADMSGANWQDSADTPTQLATDGVIDAVRVPYPLGLINSASGPQKARFFRVQVSIAP